MAYIMPTDRTCNSEGCTKRATKALFSQWNSIHGYFCSGHAQYQLQKLNEYETRQDVMRATQ